MQSRVQAAAASMLLGSKQGHGRAGRPSLGDAPM